MEHEEYELYVKAFKRRYTSNVKTCRYVGGRNHHEYYMTHKTPPPMETEKIEYKLDKEWDKEWMQRFSRPLVNPFIWFNAINEKSIDNNLYMHGSEFRDAYFDRKPEKRFNKATAFGLLEEMGWAI